MSDNYLTVDMTFINTLTSYLTAVSPLSSEVLTCSQADADANTEACIESGTDVASNLSSGVVSKYSSWQGRSHVSKIGGVHLSFLYLQTSNYIGQRRRGED